MSFSRSTFFISNAIEIMINDSGSKEEANRLRWTTRLLHFTFSGLSLLLSSLLSPLLLASRVSRRKTDDAKASKIFDLEAMPSLRVELGCGAVESPSLILANSQLFPVMQLHLRWNLVKHGKFARL